VNADLARADGINPDRERLILTLALAVVVAVALKVVGALLIAAMLVIPAAAARALSRGPEQMAALASAIGALACLAGLGLSLWQDTPAGPSIVTAAAGLFALAALFGKMRRH
jgi:zinc transport system permease protein